MFFNRKVLIVILFICLILVFICMYRENQYVELTSENTILINGTPVSNHTVILDAGHGQPDRTELFQRMEFRKKRLIYQLF